MEKCRRFSTSKTEHTDDLLHLNTEHIESKTEPTEFHVRPKTTIPKLFYFLSSKPTTPNKPDIPKLSDF